MKVVMDAQLLAGYFRETEKGEAPTYSGSAVDLVARFGKADLAYVDDDGIIEKEYRDLVEQEWFDAWFGERLALGDIVSLPARACPELVRKLVTDYGFPRKSKDRYYILLAREIVQRGEKRAVIVTEDLDFYDPRLKAADGKKRAKIIAHQTGSVLKLLSKQESITVRSVAAHLAA